MTDTKRLAILIVEDEALILNMHRRAVEGAGHKVCATATTVSEALAIIDTFSGKIDAVLLDLNLHEETSEPVAKALQAANVPFVVLTGYSEVHVQDLDIHAPVLSKPFRRVDLLNALNDLHQEKAHNSKFD